MTVPAGTPTQLFVDGKWSDGANGTFDVLDPATGEVLCTVANAGAGDVERAVSAAAEALPDWAATAPRERGEVLRKAFELMIERKEELAFLMALEMGKSLTDARGEVTYAAEFFRWFSEEAVRVGGELRMAPSGANRILTFRKPVGVALLLTPWNFPAAMATRKIGPALAAGCTFVLKPAQETPLTALAARAGAERRRRAVRGGQRAHHDKPSDLVETALGDHRVRKLSFTGSTGVGSSLLKQSAERIVNASMELGGNAPFIVLADADLDAAVEGAMLAKMRNGGQACTAANRFLVEASVADDFAQRLAAKMGELRVGPGTEEDTQLGPMVNKKAVDGIDDKVRAPSPPGRRRCSAASVRTGPASSTHRPCSATSHATRLPRRRRSSGRWRRSSRYATRTRPWRSRTPPSSG